MTDRLWYVAYGSNLLRERFSVYLTGSEDGSEFGAHPPAPSSAAVEAERWLWIDHALYFAGVSRRWTGASAFVSLNTDPAYPSLVHGYLIDSVQLAHVASVENVVDSVDISAVESLSIDEWAALDIDRRGEAYRGKYDALLRLPDIDGLLAFTLTSSIVREHGEPSSKYLSTIRRGLLSAEIDMDVDAYLDAAAGRVTSTRRGSSSEA
ncbi:hypothetical protein HQP42_18775 [Rhodococcus fascians]|nr:hypothetical protein [Rhodococcus fascians]MBY3827378.1 hypothetical protein [Rhodococcus fascians]MBY3837958.1 hypothetical protein [Rhodococcus fascians]MBY3867230.1 hypothetical protein [Rhodococcus fascians]MBY3886393.1 hypothetical protein [Rhodococcus fascians]